MRRLYVLALATLVTAASTAKADISYQYVTDAVSANGGTITATTPGQDIAVNIFLRETLTGTSTSLIAGDKGLFGFGVSLNTISGQGTTINAGAATINTTAFGGPTATNPTTGNVASQGYLAAVSTTATSGPNPDANGQILLATAHLTAGAAGSTTTFQLNTGNAFFGPGNTFTFTHNFDLDSTNNASSGGGATYTGAATPQGGLFTFTVQVAAVPEPSSMLLCGLIACGGAYGAYRRRKAQKAKASPAV
jgi:hypothetical protein